MIGLVDGETRMATTIMIRGSQIKIQILSMMTMTVTIHKKMELGMMTMMNMKGSLEEVLK